MPFCGYIEERIPKPMKKAAARIRYIAFAMGDLIVLNTDIPIKKIFIPSPFI